MMTDTLTVERVLRVATERLGRGFSCSERQALYSDVLWQFAWALRVELERAKLPAGIARGRLDRIKAVESLSQRHWSVSQGFGGGR